MVLSWLRGLFRKKAYILDGPGMVYVPKWTSFTISQTHSDSRYHFSFTVTDEDMDAFVTGVCRDEKGNEYEVEQGILISEETRWKLRQLELEKLSEDTGLPDDVVILDDSSVTLTLTYSTGARVRKAASHALAMELFRILSPYLIK